MIFSLVSEVQEGTNAVAAGLASFVKQYKIATASIYIFDVLPPLADLLHAFPMT